jgi:hypothetical protein
MSYPAPFYARRHRQLHNRFIKADEFVPEQSFASKPPSGVIPTVARDWTGTAQQCALARLQLNSCSKDVFASRRRLRPQNPETWPPGELMQLIELIITIILSEPAI